jgi:hypothetical protein
MEKEHPARPDPTWLFLGVAILLCGLLTASLQTGKVGVPYLWTTARAERPVVFWAVCTVQFALALTALALHARQFPIV